MPETRTTDSKARVTLPRAFANSTVIIEQISDSEIRIRRALVVPEADIRFYEDSPSPLSDTDRDRFLQMLEDPPPPAQALRNAKRSHQRDVAAYE